MSHTTGMKGEQAKGISAHGEEVPWEWRIRANHKRWWGERCYCVHTHLSSIGNKGELEMDVSSKGTFPPPRQCCTLFIKEVELVSRKNRDVGESCGQSVKEDRT